MAFRVLNRVYGADSYADILMEGLVEGLKEEDKALATELAYGVLRWQLRLDWAIDLFSSIKAKKLETRVLNALRIGAYQLLFLTRVPASAAVNESVNLVKKDGQRKAGFVNAVLRKIESERERIAWPGPEKDYIKYASVRFSHPEWLVKRWVERLGKDEASALMEANQKVPPKVLRANTLLNSRDELLKALEEEGLEAKKTEYSPSGIEVLKGKPRPDDKRYYIQDEGSQLISYLLSPSPGQTVLDACSAPGGKTTHLAEIMKDSGSIHALDKYAHRLESVDGAAKRLGISIIKTYVARSEEPLDLPAPLFDAILCDSPCSGLGVVRRSPDIKYRRTEQDIIELSALQKKLLSNLSRYLKKGGSLVYSTCTHEPEETAEVVRWFLNEHRGFVLEDPSEYLPQGCDGLIEERFLRTYPHRHNMDGFFAARLRREA